MMNFNDIMSRHVQNVHFNYDSNKERTFINLEELYKMAGADAVFVIEAIFINTKSRYGDAPVVFSGDYAINLPQHLLQTSKNLREDSDVVDLINNNKVGIMIYEYEGKNGIGYSVNWVENK